MLEHYRCALGTLTNYLDTQQVLNELQHAGVPTRQISIVPINSEETTREDELKDVKISDRIEDNQQEDLDEEIGVMPAVLIGSLLGSVGGCLAGLGLLLTPGVGVVLALGTWGTTLISTMAGAVIGIVGGGSIGALAGRKPYQDPAEENFTGYPSHEYLLVVEGTDEQVHQAESILERLNKTYLKTNLPSLSEHPLLDFFKTSNVWKSW